MQNLSIVRIAILILTTGLIGGISTLAAPLELTMDLDYSDVFTGDPVVLRVRLSNTAALDALQEAANLSALMVSGLVSPSPDMQPSSATFDAIPLLTVDPPWHELLRLELTYEADGGEASVGISQDNVVFLSGSQSAEEIGAEPLQAALALRPDFTSQLPLGSYRLRVTWEGRRYVDDKYLAEDATLSSNECSLVISALGSEDDQGWQYRRLADYYFQVGEIESAKYYALLALDIDLEVHLRAYYIVAEAYILDGDIERAIATYELFLSHLPPEEETKAHDRQAIELRLIELREMLESEV
jgi:tetratricopeptide (TPR) repeat protein